jgi:hypothetical protein
VVSGASIVWWVHREKAIESRKLSDAASETRARAEQGDAKAQANLASLYSHGKGVPQDYGEALRWYRKSADQGDAKAEDGLAVMYSQGQGVPQDYTEALRWYRKAADQGYAEAQYNLGNMYYYGRGVPQDRAEAERWYHKAADQGDEYAQRALGLKGTGLSTRSTISLSAMLLSLWILRDLLLPGRSVRNPQQRALRLAGLSGLLYVALSLYGDFGSFPSVLAVNAFHFFNTFVAGITVAMLISVFGPKRAKVVLGVSGTLLIGNDLIVISHHELTRFVTTVRGFSVVNGLLIGMVVPLAIFLWLEKIKRARDEPAAG